jgi:hypothetical protein
MQPGYTIRAYQRSRDLAIFKVGDPVSLDNVGDSFTSEIESIKIMEGSGEGSLVVYFKNGKMICSKENLDLLKHAEAKNKMAFETLTRPGSIGVEGRRESRPAIINITNSTNSPKLINLLGKGNFPEGILVDISDENMDMIDLKEFLSGNHTSDFSIGLIVVELPGSKQKENISITYCSYNGSDKVLETVREKDVLCDFWLSKTKHLNYTIIPGRAIIKIYPAEIKRV